MTRRPPVVTDDLQAAPAPVRLLEVELSRPLPEVRPATAETGERYERAQCLVRLHTHPLGYVDLRSGDEVLGPSAYADLIWAALGREIAAHLEHDGLPAVAGLGPAGLPPQGEPACAAARRA